MPARRSIVIRNPRVCALLDGPDGGVVAAAIIDGVREAVGEDVGVMFEAVPFSGDYCERDWVYGYASAMAMLSQQAETEDDVRSAAAASLVLLAELGKRVPVFSDVPPARVYGAALEMLEAVANDHEN